MTEVVTDRTFYLIFKSREVIVGSFHDSYHTPLFLHFPSHNGLVGNTLSSFMTKVMTRETLAIEEIPTIIKSTNHMIIVSIHSRAKLRMIYMWSVEASVHA